MKIELKSCSNDQLGDKLRVQLRPYSLRHNFLRLVDEMYDEVWYQLRIKIHHQIKYPQQEKTMITILAAIFGLMIIAFAVRILKGTIMWIYNIAPFVIFWIVVLSFMYIVETM